MKKFYLQWQSTSKMEINSREFEKKKKKTCMMSKQKITLAHNNSLNLLHIKQKFRNTTQITINFEVQKSLTILPYTNNLLKNIFTE